MAPPWRPSRSATRPSADVCTWMPATQFRRSRSGSGRRSVVRPEAPSLRRSTSSITASLAPRRSAPGSRSASTEQASFSARVTADDVSEIARATRTFDPGPTCRTGRSNFGVKRYSLRAVSGRPCACCSDRYKSGAFPRKRNLQVARWPARRTRRSSTSSGTGTISVGSDTRTSLRSPTRASSSARCQTWPSSARPRHASPLGQEGYGA